MKIKITIASVCLMLITNIALGQNTLRLQILEKETNEPMAGATAYVSATQGAIADADGNVILTDLPDGEVSIRFSFVGYETQNRVFNLPWTEAQPVIILMETDHEEFEEVTVTATRSTRSIENIPTRIEFLGQEELEEKAVMRSANIAMLLRESTGIQMQVTSPSSANQSIRIQGLDGRYTQLMKDGFPLYSGFSGGLSIMQIPPLDLQQVEVIKGSNSTLYGGGAIAGIVNLVSIQPKDESQFKLMLDQTNASGTTLNSFYAKRNDQFGLTLFASGSRQQSYDPNGDNFSDIPDTKALTLSPVLFWYPTTDSKLRFAINTTFENRLGGNLDAVEREEGSANEFLQENITRRYSYQLSYEKNWENNRSLNIKGSLLHFDRDINQFNYTFNGEQLASFSEANYSFGTERSNWLIGANFYSDRFKEGDLRTADRSYEQNTFGMFVQQDLSLNDQWGLESGFRLDYNDDYGWFALPRVALLYKATPKVSYRLGGGLGYKTPSIFTEDTERLAFRNLSAFNLNDLDAERSYGGNFDINYKTALGSEWTFSLNQLFYYTRLNKPVVLQQDLGSGSFFFVNASRPVRTQGMETNLKLTYKDFKFFLNYALIDTQLKYNYGGLQKPLTPKHNIGAVLVYEQHGKWRIGLESYYTGKQYRNDLSQTDDYWIVGFMMLRKFEKISLYANFENFNDTRQSRFESINLGTSMNPEALDVWAPLDGFILNAGIILELGGAHHDDH
ncbi:MAG: TonB-dependent receptor [Roseivirga sp.]|nr:TonB-dependent receptor [Roseivirga sp.]